MSDPCCTTTEALVSDCGRYRYQLLRAWGCEGSASRVLFVCLNPSTADGATDDPTVRKCVTVAADPVGPDADAWIARAAARASKIVLAWGNWPSVKIARSLRDLRVIHLLRDAYRGDDGPHCLGRNQGGKGNPKHPLYLPYTTPLEPWGS